MRMGLAIGALATTVMPARAEARRPDPAIATWLSLGSTLLPVGTGLALLTLDDGVREDARLAAGLTALSIGTSVGPSVGQWYGGRGGDAWLTFFLRSLTTAMMTTGIAVRVDGDPEFRDLGLATGILGGVVTGVLGVYDIATAARAAKETRRAGGFAARLRDVARCGPFPCSARVLRPRPPDSGRSGSSPRPAGG